MSLAVKIFTMDSTNPDPTLATVGDVVRLHLRATEPLRTPSVTMLGGPATVVGASPGTYFTATATVGGGADEGPVSFSVAISDPAGNAGTGAATATTDGSGVRVDRGAKGLLSRFTFASDNAGGPGLAREGDARTNGSLAAERSFGAVQTVRIFAPLPKPLTRHAKTSELRLGTLGNGSTGGLQTCLAR